MNASIQGDFLVVIGRPYTGNMERYALWVQYLGSDGALDPSDFNYSVLKYVYTFKFYPQVRVSKTGLIAVYVADEATTGRNFPDPNWVWTSAQPSQPSISVMPDGVLFTCHHAACLQTIQEVRRFTPTAHVAYVSPPGVNFMYDGSLAGFQWEEMPNGSSELVYAYVQYPNTINQNPPWLRQPPNPLPPVPTPHTAIERFEPWSGQVTQLAYRFTNGGQDGSTFVLSESIQSPDQSQLYLQTEYYANFTTASLALNGGAALIEPFRMEPDLSPAAPFPYKMTPISAWNDSPSIPGWLGWETSPNRTALGLSFSPVNGVESLAIRTRLERPLPTSQLRDVVFRSSLNGFTGQDIPITPPNDAREVTSVYVMDHPTPTIPAGNRSVMIALETGPANTPGQNKTQLYLYQPSSVAGQVGSFAPYREVLIQGGGAQRFFLKSAGGQHIVGLLDQMIPGPMVRDWVIVRCP